MRSVSPLGYKPTHAALRWVVVVTGASGIAAAGARRFGGEGASVFVVAIDEGQCRSLAAELGESGVAVGWSRADLTDELETIEGFSACLHRFGRLDGLFAVAGRSGRQFGDGLLDSIPKWKVGAGRSKPMPFPHFSPPASRSGR